MQPLTYTRTVHEYTCTKHVRATRPPGRQPRRCAMNAESVPHLRQPPSRACGRSAPPMLNRAGRRHGRDAGAVGARARPGSERAGQTTTKVLTTDGLRPAEREAYWRHALSGLLPVTITILGEGGVEGSVRLHRAGRMVVAEGKATSQDVQRTARDISQAEPEYFQIAVVASGVCRVSQDDRQAELHTGDWAVYESFRPIQLLFDSDWHACTIEHVPAGQWERVLLQASDLVASLLSDYADPSEAVRGCLQRTLMLRIKDYISQRLYDPGLRPPEIAAAANISVRYLHKLFEAEHRSVSQYIKGLRLERSRRELLDPRLADRSIATVAFACGFGDLSGFNRAFKDAYGTSPRKLRPPWAEGC